MSWPGTRFIGATLRSPIHLSTHPKVSLRLLDNRTIEQFIYDQNYPTHAISKQKVCHCVARYDLGMLVMYLVYYQLTNSML